MYPFEKQFVYQYSYMSAYSLILVTKFWDIVICLCMCKGRTGHVKVLDSKYCRQTTSKVEIIIPVTVKRESQN